MTSPAQLSLATARGGSLVAPPGAAIVRDKRTRRLYVAHDLRVSSREVTFVGELVHTDASGTRVYPPQPRRLTPARFELVEGKTS